MLGVPISKLFAAPLEAYVIAPDRARLSSFLLVAARNSGIEVNFVRDDGTPFIARISLAAFADGYLTLLITDLAPLHKLSAACDQLGASRSALEALSHAPGLDAAGRKAAETIERGPGAHLRLARHAAGKHFRGGARRADQGKSLAGQAVGSVAA